MARWFVKFEVSHVESKNRLVHAIRRYFWEWDCELLEEGEKFTIDKFISNIQNKVKEINAQNARYKAVHTSLRNPNEGLVFGYGITSTDVGTLHFYPVKEGGSDA